MAVEIIPIDLEREININANKISFITVHSPLEERIEDSGAGFRLVREKEIQSSLIKNVFPLVKRHPSGDIPHSNFLIFPEVSIPEDTLTIIENEMLQSESRWPRNSIVMGGLEYINGEKFRTLMTNCNNPEQCRTVPNNINSLNVNTAFIFVKTERGELKKYYQPKMSSSPSEQRIQNQYRGKFLLLFKTRSLVFTQIVCFDAIAESGCNFESIADDIIAGLKRHGSSTVPLRIDNFFVLQHNDFPCKNEFKKFVKNLFDKTGRELIIDAVVFINSAAKDWGCSKKFGKSRFHFLTPKYDVPNKDIIDVPKTFTLKEEHSIKYAQFREDGPCVHSFNYIPPPAVSISTGASSRYPFERSYIHKIFADGSVEHEGKAVDGLWKKIFDFLPSELPVKDPKISRWIADQCEQNSGLNLELKQNFAEIRTKLLDGLKINRIREIIDLLFIGYNENESRKRIYNPDYWEENYEGEGLRDLASGLSVFKTLVDITLDENLGKVHTALCSYDGTEFYVVFLDNPNEELRSLSLLRYKYKELIANSWGSIEWRRNTLLLMCNGIRSFTDDEIHLDYKYYTVRPDLSGNEIPTELIDQKKEKFTTLKTRVGSVFYCDLGQLRGDLERECEQIKQTWRRKIEPIRS